MSKVTKRHFRRIISNEYNKTRGHIIYQSIKRTHNISYTTENMSTASNDINNINDHNNDIINNVNPNNFYDFFLTNLSTPKHVNIEKDVFETKNKISLADKLAQWIITNNISHNTTNKLLSIMRSENLSVPTDCRTLLKTPKFSGNIINMSPGAYIYLGIEKGIVHKMRQNTLLQNLDVLPLMINIDGLPLCKSSNSQFWPILMSIDLMEILEPFIIGVYHGTKKPESVINFLNPFVEEYLLLKNNGIIINNKLIKLELKKIICDAPATSFVLATKSHTGYFGCNKCLQKGKYLRGKMTFPKLNATLRTNESFILQLQQEHHKGITPLEKIGIGLVSNVPLDYMHLVCLGVMKTLLMFWIGKKGRNSIRLHDSNIKEISKTMRIFRKYVSQDFCRLPRPIEDVDKWKATEFRQFLLYTGPIALKGKLPKVQYKHFLCLHVSIRILCSSKCVSLNGYAKSLIKYFIIKYKEIYGKEYITYNVHNLLHLCDDVLLFGKLDNFSAFQFENYMSKI